MLVELGEVSEASAVDDGIAVVELRGLAPDTSYDYQVVLLGSERVTLPPATFRTLPPPGGTVRIVSTSCTMQGSLAA